MMVSGRVSVIIPSYQREHVVGRAIDSALAQTYPDVEILVIDDGSTDGTAQVVQGYGSKVHYVYQDNQGRSAARNSGMRQATGEFIAILDSDDWWHPSKVAKQVTAMRQHPQVGLMYSQAYMVDAVGKHTLFGQGPDTPQDIFERLLMENLIPASSVMTRRDCLTAIGGFNEQMDFAEDWELWLRLAARYSQLCIPEPLSYYWMPSPDPIRYPNLDNFLAARTAAVRNGLESRRLVTPVGPDLEAQALGVSCLYAASLGFALGQSDKGTSYLTEAIALDPNMFNRPKTWYLLQNYARHEAANLGVFETAIDLLRAVFPAFVRAQPSMCRGQFAQRARWLVDEARGGAAWGDWGAVPCYLEMARQLDLDLPKRRRLMLTLRLTYAKATVRKALILLRRRLAC